MTRLGMQPRADPGQAASRLPRLRPLVFQFQSIADLFACIRLVQHDPTPPDSVEFRGVFPGEFKEIDTAIQEAGRKFRLFYLASRKCLIITLIVDAHEQLHRPLHVYIMSQAATMNLPFELVSVGRREIPTGESSEADSSFLPTSQRTAPNDWPSFVIEAGYSQSEEALKVKANWWLTKSHFAVKLVLLVKMEVNRRTIWMEKWKGMPPPVYHGPMTRSRSAPPPLEPRCVGSRIIITRAPGITDTHPDRFNSTSYNVARGDLRIEFNDVFLRPPQPPREQDFVFGAAYLQAYAASCWRVVG